MEKISFVQKLNSDDLIKYNFYILKSKVSVKINTIVIGIISIVLGIYSIIANPKAWFIGALLICLGIFSSVFSLPIMKKRISKTIESGNYEEMPEISVSISDEGVLFAFVDELENAESNTNEDEQQVATDLKDEQTALGENLDEESTVDEAHHEKKEYAPIPWNQILKVVNTAEYIYFTVLGGSILVIKKAVIEEPSVVIDAFKQHVTEKNYFEK